MIQFGFAVAIRIINSVVNDPNLVGFWVDRHTRHYADAFDHSMGIAVVLSSYQFNLG
jgi:hypothetical protein